MMVIHIGFLSDSYRIPIGSLWDFYSIPRGFPRNPRWISLRIQGTLEEWVDAAAWRGASLPTCAAWQRGRGRLERRVAAGV